MSFSQSAFGVIIAHESRRVSQLVLLVVVVCSSLTKGEEKEDNTVITVFFSFPSQ